MLPAREIPARPVNIISFQIDRRNCQSHYVFSTEANTTRERSARHSYI